MKLRTILFGLILGVSSVATAQPHRGYDNDRRGDDRHGDYRHDRDGYDRDYGRDGRVINQWLTLSAGVPNTEYRHIININSGAGRFEKVRVSVDTGRVFVRQVAVIFGDGSSRKFRIDRYMRAGDVAVVDLPGRFRALERVIVYTDQGTRYRNSGSYSVIAQRPAARPQYGVWLKYDRR